MTPPALHDTDSVVPNLAEVRDARRLLAEHLPPTRLIAAPSLDRTAGAPVHLKLECELPTGSFKPRGALYALLRRQAHDPVDEVVAASTGNHGAAVAYAASVLGIRATIFLPVGPNPVKAANIAGLGATLVERGRDVSDAARAAAAYAEEAGAYLLADATDPVLPAGPGTIALELAEQLPDMRAVYVPVGDTALIRGVAAAGKALNPELRVIGVQAEQAPSYTLSWREGRAIPTDTCDTIADGLATRTPEAPNVDAIRRLVDDFVLVSEDELLDAVRHLRMEEEVVAEPAGAAALAGFLKHGHAGPGPTVLIVSGSNVSPEIAARVAARGDPDG
jgi:threonine dehydratase